MWMDSLDTVLQDPEVTQLLMTSQYNMVLEARQALPAFGCEPAAKQLVLDIEHQVSAKKEQKRKQILQAEASSALANVSQAALRFAESSSCWAASVKIAAEHVAGLTSVSAPLAPPPTELIKVVQESFVPDPDDEKIRSDQVAMIFKLEDRIEKLSKENKQLKEKSTIEPSDTEKQAMQAQLVQEKKNTTNAKKKVVDLEKKLKETEEEGDGPELQAQFVAERKIRIKFQQQVSELQEDIENMEAEASDASKSREQLRTLQREFMLGKEEWEQTRIDLINEHNAKESEYRMQQSENTLQ